MMKRLGLALLFCAGCMQHQVDKSDTVVSMQLVDRNGFTETISNPDRIASFQGTDFAREQSYEKVLRVYGKNVEGKSASKITTYHDNGLPYQYLEAVDGRAHGAYREWFSNGVLRVEATLVEGVADITELAKQTWVFDDVCKIYDSEENVQAIFHYQKGMLVGESKTFFPSGEVESVTPYDQGLVHGAVQTFSSNGTLMSQVHYQKGEPHGRAVSYWEEGLCKFDEYYMAGKLMQARYWDHQGLLVSEVVDGEGQQALFEGSRCASLISILEGIPEGKVTLFNPDGTIRSVYFVHEGKKQGQEWEYYSYVKGESPQEKLCISWNDDKIQGIVRTWYQSGQLESQREIFDNKKQGSSFAWYKNGELMLTEEYENDQLISGAYYKRGDKIAVSKIDSGKGTATLYNADGIFLKKVSYDKGQPLLNY